MTSNEALYPIREVSSLTGVNSITLRAWERRYGLIVPVRTEGGHRLYTFEHIETIKAAVKLTEEGVPISQVKARIGQQLESQQKGVSECDYDYHSRLVEATESFDLETLHHELDQVFMDVNEEELFSLLINVNHALALQASSPSRMFWQSQVLPRLYTRLRFSLRHIALHACKKIWLQASSDKESQVTMLIAANRLAVQGHYPLMSQTPEGHKNTLFEHIQLTQCEGLAIVDEYQQFEKQNWQKWIKTHPGLEFHYFAKQVEDLVMAKSIQVHIYSI